MVAPEHGPFMRERAATQKPQTGFGSVCFLAAGAAASSFVAHITAAGRHKTTSVALAARRKKSKSKKSQGSAEFASEKMNLGGVPRQKIVDSTFALDSQIGAVAPLGGFDPLNFINGDEAKFKNFRQAEIKHGRVAMLASVGALLEHYVKLPVVSEAGNKENGLFAVMLLASVVELLVWKQDPKKEPGNFGDPLGLGMYTEDMRNKEVNNGRFAMIAVVAMLAATQKTGKDAVEQLAFMAGQMTTPAATQAELAGGLNAAIQ